MFYILTLKKETVERCLAVSVVQSKYYHLTETGCWPPAGRRQNVKSVAVPGRRRGLGKGWVWWLMGQIKQQLETSHAVDLLVFINRNGTFPLQVCLQIFSEISKLVLISGSTFNIQLWWSYLAWLMCNCQRWLIPHLNLEHPPPSWTQFAICRADDLPGRQAGSVISN